MARDDWFFENRVKNLPPSARESLGKSIPTYDTGRKVWRPGPLKVGGSLTPYVIVMDGNSYDRQEATYLTKALYWWCIAEGWHRNGFVMDYEPNPWRPTIHIVFGGPTLPPRDGWLPQLSIHEKEERFIHRRTREGGLSWVAEAELNATNRDASSTPPWRALEHNRFARAIVVALEASKEDCRAYDALEEKGFLRPRKGLYRAITTALTGTPSPDGSPTLPGRATRWTQTALALSKTQYSKALEALRRESEAAYNRPVALKRVPYERLRPDVESKWPRLGLVYAPDYGDPKRKRLMPLPDGTSGWPREDPRARKRRISVVGDPLEYSRPLALFMASTYVILSTRETVPWDAYIASALGATVVAPDLPVYRQLDEPKALYPVKALSPCECQWRPTDVREWLKQHLRAKKTRKKAPSRTPLLHTTRHGRYHDSSLELPT